MFYLSNYAIIQGVKITSDLFKIEDEIMYKSNNLVACIFIFILALAVSGCNEDKAQAFVGNWSEVTEATASKKPGNMTIAFNDGIYHIDIKSWRAFVGLTGGIFEQKFEAKSESDSVLSVIDKSGQTLRLEDGKVYFGNRVFKKV